MMTMSYNSQDNDINIFGKNLHIASKVASGGSALARGAAPPAVTGAGSLIIVLVVLFMLLDSGFTTDILINKDIDQTYSNVFNALKHEYDTEVRKGYSLLINEINSSYGASYGCEIRIDDESQVFIPETYHDDTFFGHVEKGYIRYSDNKCHVDLEIDVTPSLDDLSQIATLYYSSINSELGKADYEILTGHERQIYGDRVEDGTRYESVEAEDFYKELRETDYTLSSSKDLHELGYQKIRVNEYQYKIEVSPEVTCPVSETQITSAQTSAEIEGSETEKCVPSPAKYEYEDHVFIGRSEPGEPSGNVVEITHTKTIGSGSDYNIRNVVYLDVYRIRAEEIDNLLQYETDNSDIEYGDARTNYDDNLSFRFMNMITTLKLEDVYNRVMFSSPYGDYIDMVLIDGFYYPDILTEDIELLLEYLGLSSYDEMVSEIRRLQELGLIQNNKRDMYLQCTEFVSYMTYKIYGENKYPGVDGIRGASVLQSQGWSGSLNDVGAGTVLSRPAYDGTTHGHTMIVIARNGDNITIADANRNHRGGISVYTVDINDLNNSVSGRLEAATMP